MKQLILLAAFLLASCYGFSQTPVMYKTQADTLSPDDSCCEVTFRVCCPPRKDAWLLKGNSGTSAAINFLGTIDAERLVIRTNNAERMTVLGNNGHVLINTTTDNGSYHLQVEGSIWGSQDALINGINIGKGGGNLASNTIAGRRSLSVNTTGIQQVAMGYEALKNNTTGTSNTGIGYLALTSNTTGNNNTALGGSALLANTTGTANTALGAYALNVNVTGDNNTAGGYTALSSNTSGSYNTGFGRGSLAFNTTGNRNTGLGFASVLTNTTGYNNTGVGDQALTTNSTGINNTAVGASSLINSTTSSQHTAVGYQALYNNTTGTGNTSIGAETLKSNTTGSNNVAAGNLAGSTLASGDNNIFIGYNAQPNISTTGSNQLNIGNWIYGDNGNIGINITAPTAKAHLAAGAASAGTAPLKFTSGTNMTTPENGAVEYDGANYFATSGGARYTLAKTLTATSSLNFGSTAAQSSADLTITVTGAADGDVVSLGVPNAAVNANSNYTAWVSASNTVTVRFNNYSSGSIDPANATFRVSVTKY